MRTSIIPLLIYASAFILNAPAVSLGDVIESNDYGPWRVIGAVGGDGKSYCRLSVQVAAVPGAQIAFDHVAERPDIVLSFTRESWNIPKGTKTDVTIDFGGFHNIDLLRQQMDGAGSVIASFIPLQTAELILRNLVADPIVHFRGTEPAWIIPFPRQGDPVYEYRRCLTGQKHTQPF